MAPWSSHLETPLNPLLSMTMLEVSDRYLWGYTVHGILQARLLEWVAFPCSRGSSQPRDQTQVSCIAGGFFNNWAIREAPKLRKTRHRYQKIYCRYCYTLCYILWYKHIWNINIYEDCLLFLLQKDNFLRLSYLRTESVLIWIKSSIL